VTNEEVLRQFFTHPTDSDERAALWAPDGLFEIPFAPGGALTFEGREQIQARARRSATLLSGLTWTRVDLHATLDPDVWFALTTSRATVKETGATQVAEYANYFRLRNGRIVHRIEYSSHAPPR
jgi:ketosteroid isomerase-like protein